MNRLKIYTVTTPYITHRRSYWGVLRWRFNQAAWEYHLPQRFWV